MSTRLRKSAQILTLSQLIVFLTATAHGWADNGRTGSALDDGTETHLSSQELASIAVWAKNSEADLKDLLRSTRELSPGQSKAILVHGIRDVVLASAPKSTETLMRFALNRAIKVVDTMDKSGHADRPGESDQEVRVLTRSIEFALMYYQNDLAYINAETSNPRAPQNPSLLPYAKFGGEYAQFLMSVNESLINASAQYNIGMMVLGFLQVDLDRDVKKTEYAGAMVEIERMRALWPDTAPALDSDAIKGLKEIHRVYFEVLSTLQSTGVLQAPAPTQPEPVTQPKQNEKSASQGTDYLTAPKAGDAVIYTYDNSPVTVIGIQDTGSYVVRYSNQKILSGVAREYLATTTGCGTVLCVGQSVINTYSATPATVAAVHSTGESYVVRTSAGKIMSGWAYSYLARTSGCFHNFCVGQTVVNTYSNTEVQIAGLQSDEKFVISHDGKLSVGWAENYLVAIKK